MSERRECCVDNDSKVYEFHQWVNDKHGVPYAIVEDYKGRVRCVKYTDIRFIRKNVTECSSAIVDKIIAENEPMSWGQNNG